MSAEIRQEWPDAAIELIEGRGGVFDVTVDGDLVFSRHGAGRHAEPGEVARAIRKKLG